MKAFFDIDTQMDFVFPGGALYGNGAERLIPEVSRLNRLAGARGIPLISTTCAHPEDAGEFKVWRPHCVRGTLGQRKPASTLQPRQIIVEKNDLDPFTNPEMTALISTLGIDECFVYGVFTEYCVKCAVTGLLGLGMKVSVVLNATGQLSEQEGAKVLRDFADAGAILIEGVE